MSDMPFKNTRPQENASLYGDNLNILKNALNILYTKIDIIRDSREKSGQRSLFEHYLGRIKSEESMREKLIRRGYEVSYTNAVTKIFDAVGVRVVCRFIDDVYDLVKALKDMPDVQVVEEKDYIKSPKPNGYRSYHMIVRLPVVLPTGVCNIPAEIQIRTISQDCWASLEHEMKYKRETDNTELIQEELKRCADELASTDLSMLTIRQMIHKEI